MLQQRRLRKAQRNRRCAKISLRWMSFHSRIMFCRQIALWYDEIMDNRSKTNWCNYFWVKWNRYIQLPSNNFWDDLPCRLSFEVSVRIYRWTFKHKSSRSFSYSHKILTFWVYLWLPSIDSIQFYVCLPI